MVVIPAHVRAQLVEHARDEAPNEACGLVVMSDGVAERYERGRNALDSPYRFELEIAPDIWFLEDDGYELAVFHSHPETEPKPSRTDLANIGLWTGRPYLIYSVARDELRAYTLDGDGWAPLALEDS